MRFANLLVSTLAATAMLASAPAQPLPQLDAVLPGHRLVVNSSAVAFEYADRSHLITAAAGDTNLVFVAEPLNQQIAVLDRDRRRSQKLNSVLKRANLDKMEHFVDIPKAPSPSAADFRGRRPSAPDCVR